uniref:Uncharacterized protein n=1 Tax=Cucumis melo TaxID=3656 RepID=A0A9I9EKR7_CUCME
MDPRPPKRTTIPDAGHTDARRRKVLRNSYEHRSLPKSCLQPKLESLPSLRSREDSCCSASTMFNRLFGKLEQEANALATLEKLSETLEMVEKKENDLVKKAVAAEVEEGRSCECSSGLCMARFLATTKTRLGTTCHLF